MLEAFLAHGLGQDSIGLSERVDPIDKVDVELPHIHRKLTHPVDQGGIAIHLYALPAYQRDFLGLLGQVQRSDSMLADGFLVF